MATKGPNILVERVNLRTLLIAVVIAGLGLWLLYYSRDDNWWSAYQAWQSFLEEVGSALLVTGLLTIAWDIYGRRAFSDEILAKAQISTEIKFSGLVKITGEFHNDIDWQQYFQTVSKLDLLFVYARSWRNRNAEGLRTVAARKGARIRVILPDLEDTVTITSISQRFGWEKEKLEGLIRESVDFYSGLQRTANANGADVQVWFLRGVPQFTFYRFDNVIVFALNSHRVDLVSVPTFVCESGGMLYRYIRQELDALLTTGLARRIDSEEVKVNE